ncbi:MAG TPA: hypothetical protein VF546_22940 [Pyrinomonadaceae bacterium]|jgi:hypothetical protein
MRPPAILISPPDYDDVNAVLHQLGGRLANTRQLLPAEIHFLKDPAFLKQFRHLFLNCHRTFPTADPDIAAAVRGFVINGGALYASDWASSIVQAAFGRLTVFKTSGGGSGTTRAAVTNPYLAHLIGSSIAINFDLDGWHSIAKFPRTAEVYLWDRQRRPLAVGFSVGQGRVVYTSFHHHAQGGSGLLSSRAEAEFLKWLVTLSTQHAQLAQVGRTLVNYRGSSAPAQTVSRIGAGQQTIALHLGAKTGLGVCTLSWEPNDQLELSLAYLRHDAVVKRASSFSPPLTLTMRDPQAGDTVQVSRRLLGPLPEQQAEETYPYVFATGLRRDLLGDSDWFAAAVARHIRTLLGANTSAGRARECLNEDRLLEVLATILQGLGYSVERRAGEGTPEIMAWQKHNETGAPEVQIGVQLMDARRELTEQDETLARPSVDPPTRAESGVGTEHLLVRVSFSQENKVGSFEDELDERRTERSSVAGPWQVLASQRLSLEPEEETVWAETFATTYHLDIIVYRLDA